MATFVRPATNGDVCPYLQELEDMLEARSEWNKIDNAILKKRMGARPKKKTKPYKGAPNPVVQILDDVITEKTDQEISMIMNTPLIAHFIPLDPECPQDVTMEAQKAFDGYLRHICGYRRKKEQSVDMKNARGFAVNVVSRTDHPIHGLIPDFMADDCKDWIMPVDLTSPSELELGARVHRYSPSQVKKKGKKGWNKTAIKTVLEQLQSNKEAKPYEVSESAHDDNNALKITQKLVGLNVSDFATRKIVVWAIPHYATKWDVQRDKTKRVKEGRKCFSYVCPDVPDVLLHIHPWKHDDEYRPFSERERLEENFLALKEGREPETQVLVEEGKDKPWPIIQHRYENRSPFWYDTRGAGQKCMDNQITATAIKTAKLIWLDYSTRPMFTNEGSSTHTQNIKVGPGECFPTGVKPARLPQPPASMEFDIDAEKRDASRRVGAQTSMYSDDIAGRRKVEKTAAEVMDQSAKQGVVTSASVDRFNDGDRDLFAFLWEDMRRLKVRLPIISNATIEGYVRDEVYKYDFLIVPAASQKTLNPDQQFLKDREVLKLATDYSQAVGINVYDGLNYVITHHNPSLAKLLLVDPKEKGPQGQPPIYMLIQQLFQMMQQLGMTNEEQDKQVEQLQKLSIENSERIEKKEVKDAQGVEATAAR